MAEQRAWKIKYLDMTRLSLERVGYVLGWLAARDGLSAQEIAESTR